MNTGTIALSLSGTEYVCLSPQAIAGASFDGYALSRHLAPKTAPSGAGITRRTPLAETMYRYRYQGETMFLKPLAACFASAVRVLFPTPHGFDALLMVPPPPGRTDYAPVVALVSEISRITGIPSLQVAVRNAQCGTDSVATTAMRTFSFSSPVAAQLFAKKGVLVIDDIYRSGRSLNRFCCLIMQDGGASCVRVIAGTILKKDSTHAATPGAPYSTS